MAPPAGRPRTATNRDLPPRMIRRVRGGREYFYYQRPDGKQQPLGTDLKAALSAWHDLHTNPIVHAPGTFSTVADEYEKHGIADKKPKTQQEYIAALKRLRAVFKSAPMESIKPMHIGKLLHELRDTPTQANRIKAALSAAWNWARSRGLTDAPNPCIGIRGYGEKPRDVLVTAEMFWPVYDAADQILRDWMRLDLLLANRVTDALKIKRTDIVTDKSGQRWI